MEEYLDPYISAGERIRMFRKAWGMSLDELAQKVGTTKSTISKLERGTMAVTEEWGKRVATALEIEPGKIFGTVPLIDPSMQIVDVPVIGVIAAGSWREAVEDPIGHIKVIGAGRDAFALRSDGDSMNLLAPEGAYVLVEPNDRELHDGRVYAVMNGDGETTFKIFRTAPARLEPRSTNARHKPIVLGDGLYQIIGRVTQVIQKL